MGIVYCLAAVAWLLGPYFTDFFFDFDDFYVYGLSGTPVGFGTRADWTYSVILALFLGAILLAQWAFLRPGRAWTAKLTGEGRPLKSAVIAAAAMAMLLSVGLIALLLEIPDRWWPEWNLPGHDWWNDWGLLVALWSGMVALWLVWTWIFFVYWRQGDRYTQLGRMIRALVAGSLLEAFVAVPIHIWATRQRECYCFRGTYTTLVFAGTVLLWAFGPGLILLYWREKYRRGKLYGMCVKCGYDLRGSTDICPECGTPIHQ